MNFITSTNMFNTIDKLRKKSSAEKKMIALTISASITGIIFFIWISSFWLLPVSSGSDSKSKLSSLTPFSAIKDSVEVMYLNASKIIGGIRQ